MPHPGDLQAMIESYGLITQLDSSRNTRFSRASHNDSWSVRITLLYPPNRPSPVDNREVRTELYLQAESIVEVMKKEHFQLVNPPRIILGGGDFAGRIEGTMEVEFTF